jgi:hypothetical protein
MKNRTADCNGKKHKLNKGKLQWKREKLQKATPKTQWTRDYPHPSK